MRTDQGTSSDTGTPSGKPVSGIFAAAVGFKRDCLREIVTSVRFFFLTLFLLAASPSIAASLLVEPSSVPGKPWQGLTADGTGTLRLEFHVPEADGPVLLDPPHLGSVSATTFQPDQQGRVVLYYRPPAYLPDPNGLFPRSDSASGPAWIATTSLRLRWKTRPGDREIASDGASLEVSLKLCRPPVLLIHGFTGTHASLASYTRDLRRYRFDVIARDYFNHDPSDRAGSSVEAQADRLAAAIRETRSTWEAEGFKTARVDLVGHSLGGVIARRYIASVPATATVPVRKLIMVGTPNHGVTWLERVAARLIAEFQAGAHQRAAEQLFSGSSLFKELNAGEASGRHLRPEIQYASIIGLRSRYEHFDLAGNLLGGLETPADDDGVVTRSSAQLNGVQTYVSAQVFHTFTPHLQRLFPRDIPLTRSDDIARLLARLLLTDIVRPALAGSELIVRRIQGQVFTRRSTDEPWAVVASVPVSLGSGWNAVQTQDGRALLGLSLAGNIWAAVALLPEAELEIGYASPQLVQVRILRGQARFTSMQRKTGRFEIVLGESTGDWKEFQPRARVCNLDTDFTISAGQEIVIQSREGRVAVQGFAPDGKRLTRIIPAGSALGVTADGIPRTVATTSPSLWDDPFYDVSREDGEESVMPTVAPHFNQGFDAELGSLYEQVRETLSDVASPGLILTESGWSSDERRRLIVTSIDRARRQIREWIQRHPQLPLPLEFGLRYFFRRLGVIVDPTFTFDGDPRREAFFFAEFTRDRDMVLTEMKIFARPAPEKPLNQEHLDQVLQGLVQAARKLEAIRDDPNARADRPGGPASWKDAWWKLGRQVMRAAEEMDLAARRFEQDESLLRLKSAAKYFKLRLKEIGRSSWDRQLDEKDWEKAFTGSSAALARTIEELHSLIEGSRALPR